MPLEIDPSTEFGARVATHLAEDRIVWLTTTDAGGGPQPKPVWFLLEDGGTVLIYSQPDGAKVRHIGRNPRVSLNFNSDPKGLDVVVITGMAEVVEEAPRADATGAYVTKYAPGIEMIGMTSASFSDAYPVAIRITLETLRGM